MDDRRYHYTYEPNSLFSFDQGDLSRGKTGFSFSQTEIYHLVIAIVVLTVAFSFALTSSAGIPLLQFSGFLYNLPIAFLSISTAFFCHEIAHKFVAQRFGFWSEFRIFKTGLLIALFLGAFTGFVFAAPGAVQTIGNPNKDERGKISASGPSINIVLSTLFFIITIFSSGIIFQISSMVAYINAFLAFFNLIPFGMLDGSKIFSWRKDIWIFMISVSIFLMIFFYL